jgi:hypothetical protein
MVIGFRIGSIAALGSGTAALAMLTGLAGARADDLQINQQLLDTRIDQLAAVGQGAGGSGVAVFSVDQNSATGAGATAGSFPRSILIPGTDTSLKIYGQITEILDYYMSGGTASQGTPWNTTVSDNGNLQAIPLDNTVAKARSNGIFGQSPRESKIGFETRTPTPFGEARTVFEFDWAGSTSFAPAGTDPTSVSDNLLPRLRYAYGTLGGLLAGQATSNFSDPDANGETLDFGGNVGEPGHVRIPEIRYTIPAWWGGSLSVSAEQPETIINTPVGAEANDAGVVPTATTTCPTGAPASLSTATAATCTTSLLTVGQTPLNPAKATAPDFTVAYYIPQPWGHLDFSGVLRPGIDVTDGHYFDHQYIGFGGHFGADFKPGWFGWVKDDFIAHFVVGNTMGPYLNSSGNIDLATNYGASSSATAPGTYGGVNGPTSAASAANIVFHTVQSMGGEIGYQHWWLDNLRSNINGGFNAQYGIPIKLVNANGTTAGAASSGGQADTINKELISAHVNLIWNPVSFVDIGLEYVWGQRTVLNNMTATQNVFISKFAFRF